MEMALDSVDTEAMQIEEDAQKIRAAELVKQFKLEMGVGDTSGAQEEPELDVPEKDVPEKEVPEKEQAEGSKTIGKQRTQS